MSLCDTCTYVMHYVRRNNDEHRYCSSIGGVGSSEVPGDIVRCSDYQRKGDVTKREMEAIAWQLRTDKSGRVLGFRPPEKKADD